MLLTRFVLDMTKDQQEKLPGEERGQEVVLARGQDCGWVEGVIGLVWLNSRVNMSEPEALWGK